MIVIMFSFPEKPTASHCNCNENVLILGVSVVQLVVAMALPDNALK